MLHGYLYLICCQPYQYSLLAGSLFLPVTIQKKQNLTMQLFDRAFHIKIYADCESDIAWMIKQNLF